MRAYSKTKDGIFDKDHTIYERLDRDLVKVRILDEVMKEAKSCDLIYDVKDITEDIYLVTVYLKKNSKKYNCLRRLGFEDLNGIA